LQQIGLGLLAMIGSLAASAALAEVPHRWANYSNARFGYALCYPADLLRPQPESDNGDGRAFSGDDGAQLRVWGNYNALEQSLAEAMREDEARLTRDGATVTYRAARSNWYVLSGHNRGKLFYSRRLLTGDQFASFDLQYPARAAPLWNPVAARLSRCFTP
jgi:hypothetical protein